MIAMEIEKLCKEDFVSDQGLRGVSTVRFTYEGVIMFSKGAVSHLRLFDIHKKTYASVCICRGKRETEHADFFITRDDDGWQLRKGYAGGAVFNNCVLARHVIQKTWERCCHIGGEKMPQRMGFKIALLPLDDDKNKDVYALLRKKE
jgi:hypothetical protein